MKGGVVGGGGVPCPARGFNKSKVKRGKGIRNMEHGDRRNGARVEGYRVKAFGGC